MSTLPLRLRHLGAMVVLVIHGEGTELESRYEVEAHVEPTVGLFPDRSPIEPGDIVQFAPPNGPVVRKVAARVDLRVGPHTERHLRVRWSDEVPLTRTARINALKRLHPAVGAAAGDALTAGHYYRAVFDALRSLEQRVASQSGIEAAGPQLMARALGGDHAPIRLSTRKGWAGNDEQDGLRMLFTGAVQGLRHRPGPDLVPAGEPQRAIEYLSLISLLFRRLDDAAG